MKRDTTRASSFQERISAIELHPRRTPNPTGPVRPVVNRVAVRSKRSRTPTADDMSSRIWCNVHDIACGYRGKDTDTECSCRPVVYLVRR